MEDQSPRRPDGIDERLALLADHKRRTVVEYLRESEAPFTALEDLVQVVDDCGHGRADRTRVLLHHSTLPKLDAAGVVDYDADRSVVRYRGDPLLETLQSEFEAARRG